MVSQFFDPQPIIPGERPENRNLLTEQLEGQQLVYLHLGEPDGRPLIMPDGGVALAFELRTGERWLVWACAQMPMSKWDPRFRFRLLWRRIPAQRIQTPRSERYFSQGRDSKLPASVHTSRATAGPTGEEMSKILEGEYIAGLRVRPEPSAEGGERSVLEFRSGHRLAMEAGPPPALALQGDPAAPIATPITADMEVTLIPPPRGRRIYAMNGGGLRG